MLHGPDELPPRSDVVYVTGFRPATRWQDIQTHFSNLGLGKPTVSLIRQPTAGALSTTGAGVGAALCQDPSVGLDAARNLDTLSCTLPAGAYVLMPSQKEATRAVQVVRRHSKWGMRAMTYAQYCSSKRNVKGPQQPDGSADASDQSDESPPGQRSTAQVSAAGNPERHAVDAAAAEKLSAAKAASQRMQQLAAKVQPLRPALQRPASRPLPPPN